MKLENIRIVERMKHYNVQGLSITLLEGGEISGTENYGLLEAKSNRKVNEDSIFSACSISKFLTGILAMKLVEEGLLDLDDDVNESLVSWKVPENDFTKNKKVTLRNLLSHQSGIKDPEGSYPELNSEIGFPSMVELLEGQTPYCNTPIDVKCEPESEFHYSDAGFCIIQQLIEDVTEKPFHKVMNEQIFEPLGIANSQFITTMLEVDRQNFSCGHNKNGELVDGKYPIYPYPAAAGLWTTSLNLAELVLELMNAVKGESKVGISERLAKEMITSQRDKSWTGLGVFLEGSEKELEITSLGWGVGFQCMMVVFPYLEKGAVIMTNAELGVHQMEGIIGEIYKSLLF
ncbi:MULTISPECIES: serine hydrolase domain-containing protein [unclassified Lysinibacillus]|uniref:serine hydrolase domain-containing protein n=1 Tax=unclassified Lysinibacillus TaxID=2636778 RepID=UPI002010D82D|nr:serine hydrolase domain-containing protein [Lysinibacillus sp. BPa_S21]MCL1698184.1 beta-lactamase family protein [Lysinibacillus sp. BPa_S21]MCL1702532.1 beta-lactamase family protein [Lysinibacillus sp. Bpr_S20]